MVASTREIADHPEAARPHRVPDLDVRSRSTRRARADPSRLARPVVIEARAALEDPKRPGSSRRWCRRRDRASAPARRRSPHTGLRDAPSDGDHAASERGVGGTRTVGSSGSATGARQRWLYTSATVTASPTSPTPPSNGCGTRPRSPGARSSRSPTARSPTSPSPDAALT